MDLIGYIREHSSPLLPVETGETPRLPKLAGIRGVVFDIYGTLVISAAGDISLAGGETSPANAVETALKIGGSEGDFDPEDALSRYRELIADKQDQRKKEGIEFPEVEIREIWETLLEESGGDPEKKEAAAIAYECASNPVWPMPGLAECLDFLRDRKMLLGIVSNAQFYTQHLFPALTGKTLHDWHFQSEAMVFSYQMREGKPSRNLYAVLAGKLAQFDLKPSEILYVGNDRLKDIWPAQKEGFRTAFFGGDKRSHRWREDDSRLQGVEPDALITDLRQITEII